MRDLTYNLQQETLENIEDSVQISEFYVRSQTFCVNED